MPMIYTGKSDKNVTHAAGPETGGDLSRGGGEEKLKRHVSPAVLHCRRLG